MIKAYIGLLGEGKTLSMINDSIPHLTRGKKVVTNVPFTWKHKGKWLMPDVVSSKDFHKRLLEEENALFLIDEAAIVFPSHFWNKLSGDFLIKFAQARKYGLDIYYTSQGWNHTVKRLRDLTNLAVQCKKHNVLGLPLFSNIVYNPEFFTYKIMPQAEIERKFILGRKFIFANRAKKLYKAYDTKFLIGNEAIQGKSAEGKALIDGGHGETKNKNLRIR